MKGFALRLLAVLTSAALWALLLALGGAVAVSAGLGLLLGAPAALMCGGGIAMLYAAIILKGLS